MDYKPMPIDPTLQRLVEAGVSGLEIMRGHLEELLIQAQRDLANALETEEESGEVSDAIERSFFEGAVETMSSLSVLSSHLSFAISEKEKQESK